MEKYEAMIASGVTKRNRLELIEGSLVEKMTKDPTHSVSPDFASTRSIHCTSPRRLACPPLRSPSGFPSRDSEPEPDVSVARGERIDDYLDRHPGPADIALVVEVSRLQPGR